jgi:hypothetical protein
MAKKTMFSTENIILLGVLGIGALYLYTKYKKSSSAIPETSNSNLPNDLNPKTSDGATIEIKGKDDLIEI